MGKFYDDKNIVQRHSKCRRKWFKEREDESDSTPAERDCNKALSYLDGLFFGVVTWLISITYIAAQGLRIENICFVNTERFPWWWSRPRSAVLILSSCIALFFLISCYILKVFLCRFHSIAFFPGTFPLIYYSPLKPDRVCIGRRSAVISSVTDIHLKEIKHTVHISCGNATCCRDYLLFSGFNRGERLKLIKRNV